MEVVFPAVGNRVIISLAHVMQNEYLERKRKPWISWRLAMGPEQLTALRRQEPFRPFRICLADGRQLTVAHPELVLVGLDDVTIGFARKNSEKPYLFEHKTTVDLSDIVAFDFVDLKSAEASSQRE